MAWESHSMIGELSELGKKVKKEVNKGLRPCKRDWNWKISKLTAKEMAICSRSQKTQPISANTCFAVFSKTDRNPSRLLWQKWKRKMNFQSISLVNSKGGGLDLVPLLKSDLGFSARRLFSSNELRVFPNKKSNFCRIKRKECGRKSRFGYCLNNFQ